MDSDASYIHKKDESLTELDTYHENITRIAQALQEAGGSMSIFSEDISMKKFLLICAKNGIVLNAVYDKRLKQ